MAAELLRLGLLDFHEYLTLMKKLTHCTEFSVDRCELLCHAVEVKENLSKTSLRLSISDDKSLHETYQELVGQCLLPQLKKIVNKCSFASMSHERYLPHTDDAVEEREASHAIDNSVVTFNDELIMKGCNFEMETQENPEDENAIKVNELMLIPKLSCLIVMLLDIISESNKVHNKVSFDEQGAHLLGKIFESISQNLPVHCLENMAEEEHHKVKILSLIYANLLKGNWCITQHNLQRPIKLVVDVSIAMMETSHNADITALLLTLIVQPYVDVKKNDKLEVIKKLWQIVKKFYSLQRDFQVEEKNTTGFLILCFMAEITFEEGYFCQLGSDDALWKIIQYGLVHSNSLSRKRSQYMLKRCVDFLSSVVVKDFTSEFMNWPESENNELLRLWNDIFLLIETLEEKQAHVQKPVLEKLNNLINVCCRIGQKILHVSWILVIFKRIFDQDNKNIKQWGVMKMLKLKLPEEVLVKGVLSFITSHLLFVLSDYSLYARDQGHPSHTVSTVGDQIVVFFVNIINSLDAALRKDFLYSLLEAMFNGRPWGGIPLFYLSRALALMPNTAAWNYRIVKSALGNFESCLSTQEIVLRSASQCDLMKAILKHLGSEATFIEICDIIGHFRRKESWCRGTVLWETIVSGLDNFHENWQERITSIHHSVSKSLSSVEIVHAHDIALGMNLLLEEVSVCDNPAKRHSNVIAVFSVINNFLRDCHLRPYIDNKKFTWALELLTFTLEIFCDVPAGYSVRQEKFGCYFSCFSEGLDCVAQLFVIEMNRYNQPYDIEIISCYLDLFAQCNRMHNLKLIIHRQYSELLSVCSHLLNQENPVQISFGIHLLEHLMLYYYESSSNQARKEMNWLVLYMILHNIKSLTERRQIEGYNSTEFTSKLLVETTRSSWSCVDLLVCKCVSWKDKEELSLRGEIEIAVRSVLLSAVHTGGRHTVLCVFQVAVNLAPFIIENAVWQELIRLMWVSSLEFRKGCDLYRSLIGCMTDLLFHGDALIKYGYHKFIIQMSQQMMTAGEAVQGIAAHMSRSLVTSLENIQAKSILDPNSSTDLVRDVLVPLLMFGSVFRKQYKVIVDTTLFIQQCGQLYSTNSLLQCDYDADSKARTVALRYLLTLSKDRSIDRVWAKTIVIGIKYQYARCTGELRDFANSQKHRYKTRLLQAFLLILPLLDKNECSEDLAWLCRGLIKDHQQPSVRYMQEWGVALITIMYPQLFPDFLSHFIQGTKERVGCVGSFLAALTHIACTVEDNELLCQAIQHTLPWCMAQHFNTRLYAQVSLRKIWHHCEVKQITAVLEKYEPVQQCLQFVAEQGSAARNTVNMLNDFYFKVFHPIQHYTVETILHDLPCLSLLADDEWLTVDFLLDAVDTYKLPICSDLPIRNTDNVLAESLPAPWVIKAAGETFPSEEKDGPCEPIHNVQKKITPWKSMFPEITASLDLPKQMESCHGQGGLILVASLIDKPTNLGGLCRTCEVFSVKEYIVPSLAVLEDQTFNSLSLTAQQWIPIREVKPDGLADYLRALQSKGYTLVAAEQTVSSIKLSQYNFPKRTAVVLGNEREGIPCELLQLFDVCVEIPQTGIIRSLNVHVSGALFIWEYTRQYITKVS